MARYPDPTWQPVCKHWPAKQQGTAYLRWCKTVMQALREGIVVKSRYGHFDDYTSLAQFQADFRKRMDARINQKASQDGYGVPRNHRDRPYRNWDSDQYWRWYRDQQALRSHVQQRVSIRRFETKEARKRFWFMQDYNEQRAREATKAQALEEARQFAHYSQAVLDEWRATCGLPE